MQKDNVIASKAVLNGLVFGGLFLTLAGLIWLMYYYTQPPPPDYAHWEERQRNLAELRARDKEWLENYGWQDQAQGKVRLTVGRAMELMVRDWQNPEAGRSNLLARLEKYVPPSITNAVAPAVKSAPGGKP
jgi:hypothetical protein